MAEQNEVFLTRRQRSPLQPIDGRVVDEPVEEEVIIEESPTEEANGDDLKDLFEAPHRDDPDMRIDDLVTVSEEDVFGEGGEDMSDLVDVGPEEAMNEDSITPPAPPKPTQPRRRVVRKFKRTDRPYLPESGVRGLRP